MTPEQVKEVIFFTLIAMQGFPPIDTQLDKWNEAVEEIYKEISPSLSHTIGVEP